MHASVGPALEFHSNSDLRAWYMNAFNEASAGLKLWKISADMSGTSTPVQVFYHEWVHNGTGGNGGGTGGNGGGSAGSGSGGSGGSGGGSGGSPPTGHLYFAGNGIGRANLDGSGVQSSFIRFGHVVRVDGLAVDSSYIFWREYDTATGTFDIYRANLDGSSAQLLVPNVTDDVGLAANDAYVYWTECVFPPGGLCSYNIARANLDGSGVQRNLIPNATDEYGDGLAVDGSHIYWDDFNHTAPGGSSSIDRANLDGSSVQRGFIPNVSAVDLAVDGAHIYWSGGDPFNPAVWGIGRANLDGSGVQNGFIRDSDLSGRLGLAVGGGYIYWGRWSGSSGYDGVGRANLDGSGVQLDFSPSSANLLGGDGLALGG